MRLQNYFDREIDQSLINSLSSNIKLILMRLHYRPLILLIFSCLTVFISYGQFEEGKLDIRSGYPRLEGVNLSNTSPYPTNTLTYAPTADQMGRTIKNIITFKINENSSRYFASGFKATISFTVESRTSVGGAVVSTSKTLEVNYDKTPGSKFDALAYIVLPEEQEEVKVTVNSLTISGQSGWDPREVLELVNEMRVLRYYNLSTVTSELTPLSVSDTNKIDALKVVWNWDAACHNNMTQLEWAFVETEMEDFYKVGSSVDFNRLFNTNSTRVDVDYGKDSFRIPLLYPGSGKLYYRLRPALRKNSGAVITGPWSTPENFNFSGHEASLNWQSNTSFAENGKLKSVIQYFDGSLRNRQTVTKDNSTGNTIVGETIYDLQGRPNIQILPTPTIDNTIQYFQNFNRFLGQSANDDPARYFDLTPAEVQCSRSLPLDSMYGNGKYYSNQNPWLTLEEKSKFIPDAQGYAFTETRLMDDMTQRVRSQGGVGYQHQIGNGHETKYYYGTPSQFELDALFGTEVGDASYYTKNMVQDANGQMSVSYVDMHGRTVATALAGNPTIGIDSIINSVDYPQPAGLITKQLLTPVTNIISGNSIVAINSILVPAANNYDFTYKLDPGILRQLDCNKNSICFDCKYDLEISIRSEDCGDSTPIVRRYQNLQIVPVVNACDSSMSFHGPGADILNKEIRFNQFLSTGSYIIRKTLTVNDSMFSLRRDSALKVFLCRTEQEIYDSVVNVLYSISGCALPPGNSSECDSCRSNLGTFAQYRQKYLIAIGQSPATSNTLYDAEIYTNYKSDSLNCVQACGLSQQLSTLASLRNQMLNDMIPFTGQYAIDSIRNDTLGTVSPLTSDMAQSVYNIFTLFPLSGTPLKPFYLHPVTEDGQPSVYFDEENNIDNPDIGIIPPNVFSGLFKPSWAKSLIYYHPEFTKLKLAEGPLRASYEWMDRFMSCESYQIALDSDYVHPTLSDPFFTGGFGSADIGTMNQYLTSHLGTNSSNPSIWKIANGMVLCVGLLNENQPGCINSKNGTGIQSGLTSTQQDDVWEKFKSVYLSYRNEMVLKYINNHESAILPTATMTELKNEGKRLIFATAQDLADQNGWEWWSTLNSANPDTAGISVLTGPAMPVNTCAAQRYMWKAKLLQCDELSQLLENQTSADSTRFNSIINSILDGMESVCNNSKSSQQPYGSSNVPPTYSGTPQNFEQVINSVFEANNIYTLPGNHYYCNPFTIDYPKPYGLNPPVATNYSNIIDSCNCLRFAELKLEAGADSSSFASMNNFLILNYHDSLSMKLWEGLQYCTGRDSCNYILSPATLEEGGAYRQSCPPPIIYSASWTDGVYMGKRALMITYADTAETTSFSQCSLKVISDTTLILDQSVNCDSSSIIIYLDSCQTYTIILEHIDSTCQNWSNTVQVEPSCNVECDRPVLSIATIVPGQPVNGNEIISLQYTLPAGSDSCYIKVLKYINDTWQFSHYKSISCSSISDTIQLPACHKYKLLIQSIFDSTDCKKVESDPIYIDSCYQVHCQTVSGSFTIRDFVVIPQFFNCGYKKPCISCYTLDTLTTAFHNLYPSYSGVPFLDSTTTDEQARQNSLWARFINYRVGFFKNAIDYLQAYHNCPSLSSNATAICAFDPPFNDPSDIYPPNNAPCSMVETQAQFIAQQIFNNMKDSLIANFDSLYLAKCLEAKYTEQFYVNYYPKEYHYTLYYYDLAGNLVKTMPPAAVKPNFDASYLASVNNKRNSNQDFTNPLNNEQLGTNYRYNSLNQVIAQQTPDAGVSKFWYDRLGRLAISQNAKQILTNKYSYTIYDDLGRITEVGERPNSTAMTQIISQDASSLSAWIENNSGGSKQQITKTIYDEPYTPLAVTVAGRVGLYQQNLRNRVSYTYIDDNPFSDEFGDPVWDAATFYSYDIHGNVDTLLQDFRTGMGSIECFNEPSLRGNRFKKIVYNYDLISGKVNTVAYQAGYADEFYHRYEYDAENKLKTVQTSKDKIYWEQDATYDYYRHGPLARTVLGQNQVQGLDYAYTIQGWLKGVNSTAILSEATGNSYDMGTDGTGLINPLVARDAFGYSLNYFNNDYKPIGGTSAFTNLNLPLPADPVSGISTGYSLFNGNIAAMAVNIPVLGDPEVYAYRYDQLNRIKRMDAISGLSQNNTTIVPVRTAEYHEEVKYDPNGNILGYLRNGTTKNSNLLEMDSLNYQYYPNTNKLKRVTDKTAYSNNYKSDIDHQPDATNYTYDAIGNLIQDKAEGITNIEWTVYGKIKSITKSNGAKISYTYDASGNRISQVNTKGSTVKRTYYVRDASGNVMSIYSMTDTLKQKEINLYGSSRLGIYNVDIDVQNCNVVTPEITKFTRGNKSYELNNHLGNVLATISDKHVQVAAPGNTVVDYYLAEVLTATDYYPFGMQMPKRQYYIDTTTYIVGTTSTTSLIIDSTVIELYKHSFSDTPSVHPYVTIPNTLNVNLNNSIWTNSRSMWTNYASNTSMGKTIAFDNSTSDTSTVTLTLNIASNKKVGIKSFSFYNRVSNSGYRHWKMYINGIEVGDSLLYYPATGGTGNNTVKSTGTVPVKNVVEDLTGSITVLLKLYDHDAAYPNGNAQGTFRMDDFILNGYVNDDGGSVGGGYQYANKGGYRYGFNGKENDGEISGEGNSIHYEFREYDPRIGRFKSVDPMAAKTPGESPYSSMGNNPILNIDPDGNFAVPVHKRITINAFNNSGLSKGFLSRFKTDLVVGATRYSDYYGFAFDHHFDGRKNFTEVQATWTKLNNDIDSRINNIGSGNKKFGGYDVERLGINVHNVQDFYSHSNYVELYVEYYKAANNGAMPTEVPIYTDGLKIEGFKALMERTTTDANGKYQGLNTGSFSVGKFVKDKAKGRTDTDPNSHEQMNKDEVDTPEGKLAEDVATRHTTEILKRVKEK